MFLFTVETNCLEILSQTFIQLCVSFLHHQCFGVFRVTKDGGRSHNLSGFLRVNFRAKQTFAFVYIKKKKSDLTGESIFDFLLSP